jgi:hypothetical protein
VVWANKQRDPLLGTYQWRVTIRHYWIRRKLPCSRCHQPIDYDGPRYLVDRRGRRRLNPRYLVVGHKVDRYTAQRMGWTEQQVNAITNTQPECAQCSHSSGAKLGQRIAARPTSRPSDADRW